MASTTDVDKRPDFESPSVPKAPPGAPHKADMRQGAVENYPLEPVIILDLAEEPAHSSFSRELRSRIMKVCASG